MRHLDDIRMPRDVPASPMTLRSGGLKTSLFCSIVFKITVTKITDTCDKSNIIFGKFDIKTIKVSSCVNISFPGIKNWIYIGDYCTEVIPPWLQYLSNCDSVGEIFINLDKEISKLESKLEYKKLKDLCI